MQTGDSAISVAAKSTNGAGEKKRGPYAKSAETREAILEAAYQIFCQSGFRGASLKAVTDRVGVAQPLIFRYFKTKDDLLAAVLALRDQRSCDISPLDVQRPIWSLRRLVALMRHNEAHKNEVILHSAMAGEAIEPHHPGHEFFVLRYSHLLNRLTEILELCREQGCLKTGWTPAHAARIITAAMDGLQTQWLLNQEENLGDEFEQLMRMIVDLDGSD